ncbi:MAG: NADP-dependent oxidoreductase [Deltaproteobacteria bacterium]
MKAIRIHQYGGPEQLVLEEAPRPEIGDDEVLVRVWAAGVNPVDWKVRQGYLSEFLGHHLPLIPGWDFAGLVDLVGAEVRTLQPGDRVYGLADLSRDGSYAEYIAVKASSVAPMPASLCFEEAAAVPLTALTAWQALFDQAGLAAGQKVLVHGAAGGVGHFAVQFANWCGAHVVGTASGRHRKFLDRIGVHEVIDYTAERFEERVREVDVVLDSISGEVRERSWQVLKKGGVLVGLLPPEPEKGLLDKLGVRFKSFLVQPNSSQLGEITALIDSKLVKPHIFRILSLAAAAEAQREGEAGHMQGKLVLRIE